MRNRSVLTQAIPATPPTLVPLDRTLVLVRRLVIGPSVVGDHTHRLVPRVDRLVHGAIVIPRLGRRHRTGGPVDVPLHTAGRRRRLVDEDDRSHTRHHRGMVADVLLRTAGRPLLLVEGDGRSRTRHRRRKHADGLLHTVAHPLLLVEEDGQIRIPGRRGLMLADVLLRTATRRHHHRGKLVDGLLRTVAHPHLLVEGDGRIRTRRRGGLAPDVDGVSHTTRGVPVRIGVVAHRLGQ